MTPIFLALTLGMVDAAAVVSTIGLMLVSVAEVEEPVECFSFEEDSEARIEAFAAIIVVVMVVFGAVVVVVVVVVVEGLVVVVVVVVVVGGCVESIRIMCCKPSCALQRKANEARRKKAEKIILPPLFRSKSCEKE